MKFYSVIKRILDIVLALILLFISLPFIVLFSIIIALQLKRFPIFTQERGLTLSKYRFKIFKLRTIKNDNHLEFTQNSVQGIFIQTSLSKNITPFTAWLRKTGIDEFPQFLNIILGQMSFIGPRPLMLSDLKIIKNQCPKQYSERDALNSKPGISGMWQIFGDREQGIDNLIGLDFVYDKYRSFYLDMKLFIATIPLIFAGENSDAILYKKDNFYNKDNERTLFSLSTKFKLDFKPLPTAFKNDKIKLNGINYKIDIPNDWWYVTDTYKVFRTSESSLKIVKLKKRKDSA